MLGEITHFTKTASIGLAGALLVLSGQVARAEWPRRLRNVARDRGTGMETTQLSRTIRQAPGTMPVSGGKFLRFLVLTLALLMFGDIGQLGLTGSPMTAANARIGRPLTPLSYAGVARRTARRHYYCHGILYYHPCY
jgi:hypothetical protein